MLFADVLAEHSRWCYRAPYLHKELLREEDRGNLQSAEMLEALNKYAAAKQVQAENAARDAFYEKQRKTREQEIVELRRKQALQRNHTERNSASESRAGATMAGAPNSTEASPVLIPSGPAPPTFSGVGAGRMAPPTLAQPYALIRHFSLMLSVQNNVQTHRAIAC